MLNRGIQILCNNRIVKNKKGLVRSGWIILGAMAILYGLSYLLVDAMFWRLRQLLIYTGDINPATGHLSPFVDWMNDTFLPLVNQILWDVMMIAILLVIWRFVMKHPLRQMGLISVRVGWKEGLAGMLLGIVGCTVIFLVLILSGQAVVSWKPAFSVWQLGWLLAYVLIAFGEEIMNRSFFMSTLRRVGNIYFIALIPSVIFGLIHMLNPGFTFFSMMNIVLIGILFSYIYIKSGNVWMCIGYHFTWNTFQGLIFGMPVSGLDSMGILSTHFTTDNFINGGAFGIEGGVLTTIVILLEFIFVKYYYRNSRYDFILDTTREKACIE